MTSTSPSQPPALAGLTQTASFSEEIALGPAELMAQLQDIGGFRELIPGLTEFTIVEQTDTSARVRVSYDLAQQRGDGEISLQWSGPQGWIQWKSTSGFSQLRRFLGQLVLQPTPASPEASTTTVELRLVIEPAALLARMMQGVIEQRAAAEIFARIRQRAQQ